MDLVYKVSDYGTLVFAERDKAIYAAQLYDALQNSATWSQFRAKLPSGGWEEFVEKWGARDDDDNPIDEFPTGEEPFEGLYTETGYPEWLANTAIKWFPKDLVEKYGGSVDHSIASDSSLYLPADNAEDIAAELRARGHTVEHSPVDLI